MMSSAVQQLKPVVSPRGAPANGEVTVSMVGLPAGQEVRIGFGSFSQNQAVGRGNADATGSFSTTVRIPDWARADGVHFFFASFGNLMPRAFSDPFVVTDPRGAVRVSGLILTAAGSGCRELVGPDDTLYALRGDLEEWHPGLRVRVVGTVVDEEGCTSEGVPIAVQEIRQA